MKNVIYIDTRPGKSIFAAPKGEPDYTAWVTNSYKRQQYKDGEEVCFFGLTQKLHEILWASKKQNIVIFGIHAGELEQFIMLTAKQISKKINIEVINGG